MTKRLDESQIKEYLQTVPDDVLTHISFSVPWQYGESTYGEKDADGFPSLAILSKEDSAYTREVLQQLCFTKAHRNPQVNTAVRGRTGRLVGWGFEVTSGIYQIHRAIKAIEKDPRNRLYYYLPKWVARSIMEGELFLCFTVHTDGFIEVDFVDPGNIVSQSNADGIIFHPDKSFFPLFYNIREEGKDKIQIPSIFCARYPDLLAVATKNEIFSDKLAVKSRSRKHIFRQFKGYYKFIVAYEKGFMTRRAISYLRTVLEWVNHYENLKKYEIDHKKAAGAYLWIFKITDPKSFKLWLSLSDEDRRKTGIMAKKTPGSSLVLPPGMEVDVVNPQLSQIKEQDTDILQMITSGMDEPEDVTTGQARGTFASVKASRGPMSDRVSDEAAYFKGWYINDFWGSIFFLKSAVSNFPKTFKVKEAVGWKDDKTPNMQNVKYRPEELIEVSFPVSDSIDMESRAKPLLGVKHGPVAETLGIPNSEVAKRLGFGGYEKARLRKATEDERLPELLYETGSVDTEKTQEKIEGEPKKK